MSPLRDHMLSSAYESVIAKASFRRPQHEAFEKFHRLIGAVGRNIAELSQQELADRISDLGFGDGVPSDLLFDLATGVGKTRLLGGILVYLARARQTRNCLLLAPRVTILDKFKRECDPASSKYLFLDRSLVPNPNICFRNDLLAFEPDPSRLNVFILSPQTITGTDRKFATAGDFGPALRDYMSGLDDLVVFSDEAHHFGNNGFGAWRDAVSQLRPKLHLGFTATAPRGSERKVLYSYGLNTCLAEGRFTKAVKLWIESKPDDIEDEDWDRQTIDFGLRRLEAKQAAIEELVAKRPDFPTLMPVLLVAAKDIAHAERVGAWLKNYRDFGEDEVLVAHSGKKGSAAAGAERAIGQLVSIDRPGSRIRVVVNVFQLSEGWDVTNVWVVAPLRSLATFTNAIQTIGRGLRLPVGRRIEDEEADTLDVLCFGKEDFGSIVQQAIRQFGPGPDGSAAIGIVGTNEHRTRTTRPMKIEVVKAVSFTIPEVVRTPGEPVLEFSPQITRGISSYVEVYDVGSREFGTEDGSAARRDFEAVVRTATSQVMNSLRFLDPVRDTAAVAGIIRKVLEDKGGKPGMQIATDATKLALAVADAIRTQYRSISSTYMAGTSSIEVEPASFEAPVPTEFEKLPSKDTIVVWK